MRQSTPTAVHAALATDAAFCQRCELWRRATQTVFGEGPTPAGIMMVGDQPDQEEDRAGRPFVGSAGRLLDAALAAAGIARSAVYLTHAVKHFATAPRGRPARPPGIAELAACRRWLDQERLVVRPRVIVLLGPVAARAVLHRATPVSQARGWPIELGGITAFVTIHPSTLLHIQGADAQRLESARFVADLRQAADHLHA